MRSPQITRWALVILMAIGAAAAHADDNGIKLGTVSAGVKGKVIVPVLLELANEDVKVGHITATIGYNANVVAFQQAEKGFLLDGVGGKFTATAKPDGEKSTIQLDILTEGEPRQALRKGLVVSLVFKINEKAPVDTRMPLPVSNAKLETIDSSPKPIEPLALAAGEIQVLSPENVPFVACFFFTH